LEATALSGAKAPRLIAHIYHFGAGPRVCIGATFAMAEAQIMMATLLRRYRVICTDPRPVLPVSRVTIEPSFLFSSWNCPTRRRSLLTTADEVID